MSGCFALIIMTAINNTWPPRERHTQVVNTAAKSDPFKTVYVIDWR